MARLNEKRQQELEPKRIEFAKNILTHKGFDVEVVNKRIEFYFNDRKITLYPYSGWFTGKTIKDGRGIDNLLKQLN